MDINPIYIYKNAEIELVVEDDVITTAKIYMDGECAYADDSLTDDGGKDLKFTPRNRKAIINICKKVIDKELAEDDREECVNMSYVKI